MTNEQAYDVWAPEGGLWSPWVAPVLFTQLDCGSRSTTTFEELLPAWITDIDDASAVVLDINGVDSVRVAVALAHSRAMTPVPLFNASPGPLVELGIGDATQSASYEVVPMRELIDAMCWGTERLLEVRAQPANSSFSAPVFMLDSRRLVGSSDEGLFDNRWMLVPQDFPSANFLKAQGIRRVILAQPILSEPQHDLAHVLLRYKEQGIELVAADEAGLLLPLNVKRPPFFKEAFYRVLARMGLRRNALGGFGSWVPESGGGG